MKKTKTRYKVSSKGNIYVTKDKDGYSLKNAKVLSKRRIKKTQRINATNIRMRNQRIRAETKRGKKRIQKKRKRASDIKRRKWKTQAKSMQKYEARKKRSITKAKRKRDTSWSYY